MRTYIIWDMNKTLLIAMCTSLGVLFGASAYFIQRCLISLHCKPLSVYSNFVDLICFHIVGITPNPVVFPGCFVIHFDKLEWVAFMFIAIFETLLLCIHLYKSLSEPKLQMRFKEN